MDDGSGESSHVQADKGHTMWSLINIYTLAADHFIIIMNLSHPKAA